MLHTLPLIASLSLAMLSQVARAEVIPTVKSAPNTCVDATAEAVHSSITNYESWVRLKGATLKKGFLQLARMSSVQEKAAPSSWNTDGLATDKIVYVEIQPAFLGANQHAYYVKFLLRCSSKQTGKQAGAEAFSHQCYLLPNEGSFGLRNFAEDLTITGQGCANGQTRLEYTIRIETNGDEIDQIKNQLDAGTGAAGLLFNPPVFFRDYYQGFFQSWKESLTK